MSTSNTTHSAQQDDDTRRCADRLSHYAIRLSRLIRLCDPALVIDAGDTTAELTSGLHREVRADLKREYDTGDHRALTAAETITQRALYGAYTALSPGSIPRSIRMLAEARKSHRVIRAALGELGHRPVAARDEPTT
jgi:hypothetical protein